MVYIPKSEMFFKQNRSNDRTLEAPLEHVACARPVTE